MCSKLYVINTTIAATIYRMGASASVCARRLRYSSLIPTTLPAMPVPTARLRFILLPCMLALAACSTQVELRMAQQQEQWANEAARQGHWPQALRTYEEAIDNVELGHGDTSWQARLHQQAAQAAGAACRARCARTPCAQRGRAVAACRGSRRTGTTVDGAILRSTSMIRTVTLLAIASAAPAWPPGRHCRCGKRACLAARP